MSNKKISIILLIISIILVLVSTYAPRIIDTFFYHFDKDLRITFKLCGVLLSAWGIAFLLKKE